MPTSDPNGLPIFNESDATVLHTLLNTLSSGMSNWINGSPRFKRVATIAARNALVSSIGTANITADSPLLVWRADAAAGSQLEYTTNGTTWDIFVTGQYLASQNTGGTITLNSGFTGTGLAYEKIGRLVYLRGAITRNAGAFPVGTTAVGTLPVGARPSAFGRWPAAAAPSSTAMIPALQIDGAGAMSVLISGTSVSTAIYVDGVAFIGA